jgi:heme/copper-type cytochrome/quinol oxidase subunit 2
MVFLAQLNAPEPWQLTFQNPSTPVMEGIINFYYDLSFFIVFIAFFVSYLLGICIYLFKRNRTPSKVLHGTVIEII